MYMENLVPSNFYLSQNFPNPFNATTTIQFSLPKTSYITLNVYNSTGELVSTPLAETLSTGVHRIEWNADEFPSGVYFYKLSGDGISDTKKMILVR